VSTCAEPFAELRGDARGGVLLVEDLLVSIGDVDLVENACLQLQPREHVGIVGGNGAGKSTLLRCIMGELEATAGRIAIAHKVEVGYLRQTAVSGSTSVVRDEVRGAMTHVVSAEAEMALAEAALEQDEPGAADRLQRARDRFEALEGFQADKRVAAVLSGLGFSSEKQSVLCSELSGGWQMRVALAKLLVGPAGEAAGAGGGLLLLDEPTNHLDARAKDWLAGWLKQCRAAVLLVSHDEPLLDGVCDGVVEVRGGRLHAYRGGFSDFLRQREDRIENQRRTAEKQAAEAAKLEGFINRFGAKATKASAAKSKQKALDKLNAQRVEVDKPVGPGAGDARSMALRLPEPPACAFRALQLKKASLGYQTGSALLTDIDFTLERGMRCVVVGPNGAGKSTLLKSLAGDLRLLEGARTAGQGVALGVFNQDLAQELPLEQTGLEYVRGAAITAGVLEVKDERIRAVLGALGLSGPAALRPIGNLSGGEKARVALAAFIMRPCNALLLDEASNHLDAVAVEALTDGLQTWQGALLAITHNPTFAKALRPTHLLRVSGGSATLTTQIGPLTEQDLTAAADPQEQATSDAERRGGGGGGGGAPTTASSDGALSYADQKRLQKAKTRIGKLWEKIERAEGELAAFDADMAEAGADTGRVMEINEKRSAVESAMEEHLAEAEELEEQLAAAGMEA